MQGELFEMESDWEKEWREMPEYDNWKEGNPVVKVLFKFKSREAFEKFQEIIKRELYNGKKVFDGMQRKNDYQAWYPHLPKDSEWQYVDEK